MTHRLVICSFVLFSAWAIAQGEKEMKKEEGGKAMKKEAAAASTTTGTASEGAYAMKCSLKGMEGRKVEVVNNTAEDVKSGNANHLCSVTYTKGTDVNEDLYYADADPNYCREKAEGLVSRLSDGGWNCESTTASSNES